jgi:hypothetical protein
MIILLPPLLDNRLCFSSIRKDPTVQTLSSKSAVELLPARWMSLSLFTRLMLTNIPLMDMSISS